MNFSLYSCRHFSDFLSDDEVRKQSAMSKRGQKTTSNEGFSMAEARPCLVARDPRSEDIFSRSLESLVDPVNTNERKDVEIASRKQVRPDSRSEVGYSQASRQENVPLASRKLMREDPLHTNSDERKHSDSNGTTELAASSPRDTRKINTFARSSSFCKGNWECQEVTQHSQCKHTKQMY